MPMYPLSRICGPNMVNLYCMAIEKLIKSHKYDIVNTITTAGKPIPMSHFQ